MPKAKRPPGGTEPTKTDRPRRKHDPSFPLRIRKNRLFKPNPKLEPLQQQAIRDYIAKQVSRWAKGPETIEVLVEGAHYSIGSFKDLNAEAGLRWSKQRAKPLINAGKAASELVLNMEALDGWVRAWFSPPGSHSESFATMLIWSRAINEKLSLLVRTAPNFTPPHQRNYAIEDFVRHLLPSWRTASGKVENTSVKEVSFIRYAVEIALAGELPTDQAEIAQALRQLQDDSARALSEAESKEKDGELE